MDSENIKKQCAKKSLAARASRFFSSGIWDSSLSGHRGLKGFVIAFIRILIATVSGIINKRILVQASSLSYATLLAVGPILAITILFSGLFFRDKGEDFIYEKIMSAVVFVMPAFNEMAAPDGSAPSAAAPTSSAAPTQAHSQKSVKINPQIFEFINNISKGSASAGTIGILTMLLTCLLLCVNMGNALNYIWGVRKGRSFVNSMIFYFVMIFFGSAGLIFGTTFFATSQLAVFVKDIPFISGYASWITYIVGIAIMTGVLASFYKFIPFTTVNWRPAIVGAAIVVLLIILNNRMSFVYISYIVKQQNFYGYLAIVAVAMFSLYIFWTVILTGGQITYAVQYVNFLSDDQAWNNMGGRARAICALAVFAEISRSLYDGAARTPTLEDLIQKLKLPKSVITACAAWLAERGFICKADDRRGGEPYFKPEVSPDCIDIAELFERLCTNVGDAEVLGKLARDDAAAGAALASIDELSKTPLARKKIKDILNGLI